MLIDSPNTKSFDANLQKGSLNLKMYLHYKNIQLKEKHIQNHGQKIADLKISHLNGKN
jgi:hypothetical protein